MELITEGLKGPLNHSAVARIRRAVQPEIIILNNFKI